MRLTFVFNFVLLSGFSVALAQTGADQKSVKDTIMRMEQEMIDGLLKGDASPHERYKADTFILTTPQGTVIGKAENVAEIKSGAAKMYSCKLDDVKLQVYEDTAVLTLRSTEEFTYKGKKERGQYRWTEIFHRQNGQWQMIASHGSVVPAK